MDSNTHSTSQPARTPAGTQAGFRRWSPTPTVPRPRPNGSISGGACGCRPPGRAWSPSRGCWTPRPARPCSPPWSRWPAPPTPRMRAAVASVRADALTELARRTLESGQLPQSGGVRPQLLVTVDLDSLLSHPDGLGGETGGPWPLDPETCRRLACDAAVTRVLVTRHPTHQDPDGDDHPAAHYPSGDARPGGLAPDGGDPAPPDPGRRPHPTAGGRPDQPGRHPRPTHRPDRPRRRLCGGRLRPTPGLVRSPPPPTLAPRRPHRPRQPGPALPGPPSRGPRGRLAAHPPARWPARLPPHHIENTVPPPDPATP